MKAPLAWLREFADVPDDAKAVGARLAACGFEVAGIEGDTIDVEITANRPDCLSVIGLAREAATAFDKDLKVPADEGPPSGVASVRVSIGRTPRYSSRSSTICPASRARSAAPGPP